MENVSLLVLILFCITSLICFVYIINKCFYLKSIGIEDLFFVISYLFSIPYTLATIYETGGIGIITTNGNVFWVYSGLAISYYTILWSIRLYLIYSYKKILKEVYKPKCINTIICFFILSYISLNIQFILSCTSTPGFISNKVASCREIESGTPITQLLLNITSDLILLFLPSRVILKSRIKIIKKINLIGIFSSVLLLTVIGVVHNIYQFFKDGTRELIWATLEINIGIIIITFPSFYKLLIKIKNNTKDNDEDADYYINVESHELNNKNEVVLR